MHMAAMVVLSFLACVAFTTAWGQARAVIFVFIFSAMMEVLQNFTPTRSGSWEDVAMNALGCLAGVVMVSGADGCGDNQSLT